jgi:ABC-type phosphate transport system ATPase subunit
MQQAAGVSDTTFFFYMGELIEYEKQINIQTGKKQTEDYITGRSIKLILNCIWSNFISSNFQ